MQTFVKSVERLNSLVYSVPLCIYVCMMSLHLSVPLQQQRSSYDTAQLQATELQ